jgi:5-formyltetrahydrofolate cyclo-ligase
MPDEVYEAASARIRELAFARLAPVAGVLVGGYWPIRREVDCVPLLEAILAAGGAVALPVATGPGRPLEFRPWAPGTAMAAGPWDIPHPAEGPAVRPDALLVPLVGFDSAGHRLGYGGGYYDRTLAALPRRPLALGLGFELGRLASIRPRPHDAAMDAIVTEAGVFETAGR